MDYLKNLEDIYCSYFLLQMMLLKIPLNPSKNSDFFIYLENCARSVGICELIKMLPSSLQINQLRLPSDLCSKYSLNIRSLWDRVNGTPRNELKDAVLEIASMARIYLQNSIPLQQSIPPSSLKGLLQITESEFFLECLEKADFNVFSSSVWKKVPIRLCLRLMRAHRQKKPILYLTSNDSL